MSKEYNIRKLIAKDENQVVDLLRLVFDEWPIYTLTSDHIEHLQWKYRDNPLRMDTSIVVEYDEHIVACYIGCPKKINIKGQEYLCGSTVDLAVHPNHRGKGLYSRMSELSNKQRKNLIDFTLASSNNEQVINYMRRRGNKFFPQKINNFIYIDDIDLHFKRSNDFLGFLKKIKYLIQRGLKTEKMVVNEDITVEKIEGFDESIIPVLNSMLQCYDFSMYYVLEYLNWRYADPRSGDYTILVALKDDVVLGFIVVLINRIDSGYPNCVVQELLVYENRAEIMDLLISKAIDFCRDDSVNYIRTISPLGSFVAERLEFAGFIKTDLMTEVWFRPFLIGDGLGQIDNIELDRIHLMPGFFDAM